MNGAPRRVVLAITGASGMPFAWRLLQCLAGQPGLETHCIVSDAAQLVLAQETPFTLDDIDRLAFRRYRQNELGAGPASGSWQHQGMVVCPCSMASLAAIANGLGSNLIHRAADVTLKERRPLLLAPRETPLNRVHLTNLLRAAEAGATIMPPCPAFYTRPRHIDDLVDQFVARLLDHLDLPHTLGQRWQDLSCSIRDD